MPKKESTLKVKSSTPRYWPSVTADGDGLVSHAGAMLLSELADRVGLTDAMSKAMAPSCKRSSARDRGAILRDFAVMLADGGDCIADLAVLRSQPEVFGEVVSDPTAWRVLAAMNDERLRDLNSARAKARKNAWESGVGPEGELVLDFDATLVTAYAEKENAAGNYKHGFGFHPLLCYLDNTGEALAGKLRPGNAAAQDAKDHIAVLDDALAQIPRRWRERPVLARADSAGASREFTHALRERGIQFSVGFDLTAQVREAILEMPEKEWWSAMQQDGEDREGAQVCELELDLSEWPEGTRAICRREEPHPGAQLTFTDVNGYRFLVFITDQQDEDIAYLEARHRGHARVENRIRCGKATGMRNLPMHRFAQNAAWLQLVLVAQDLLAWIQRLCLGDTARTWEPKRIRHRLFHIAGRIVHSGRQITLRLQRSWPWVDELIQAFTKLRSLPVF